MNGMEERVEELINKIKSLPEETPDRLIEGLEHLLLVKYTNDDIFETHKFYSKIVQLIGFDDTIDFDKKATPEDFIKLFDLLRRYAKNWIFA